MVCAMPRQVALLRGINVGGNKPVAMAALRELFAELGYEDVTTYVNSGNVVFSGPKATAKKLERAIEEAFGFDVAVVLRSRDDLATVVEADPFAGAADNPSRYLVLFSGSGKIDPKKAEGVQGGADERFAIVGAEAYLWLPGGFQKSRLLKEVTEKRLGVTLTGRNWRTVEKLLALADSGH
jgi:uncharacterized protein (DUF1697 family)